MPTPREPRHRDHQDIAREVAAFFTDLPEPATPPERAELFTAYHKEAAKRRWLARSLNFASPTSDLAWEPRQVAATSEALAHYSFSAWLSWHVTSLGSVAPWMSGNTTVSGAWARALEEGLPGAFALSERPVGADWRNTRTTVTMPHRPDDAGTVTGVKDYVGNGNVAPVITTFAKYQGEAEPTFCLFLTEPGGSGCHIGRNMVDGPHYVARLSFENYSLPRDRILSTGPQAFADALNSLNIAKFNLATGVTGLLSRMLEHARHYAQERTLFDTRVADFPQNRARLLRAESTRDVMHAFNATTVRRLESAAPENNDYLVWTALAKAFTSDLAMPAVDGLTDVLSARAFEADSPYAAWLRYIDYYARLEGTNYINYQHALRFAMRGPTTGTGEVGPTSVGKGRSYLMSQRPAGTRLGFTAEITGPSAENADHPGMTADTATQRCFRELEREIQRWRARAATDPVDIEARGRVLAAFLGYRALQEELARGVISAERAYAAYHRVLIPWITSQCLSRVEAFDPCFLRSAVEAATTRGAGND